jgi:phosphotransferase system enzyme I (PtsI)
LGIPTVLCVEYAEKLLKPGTTAIVDGTNGIVVSAPNSVMLKDYINRQAEFNNQRIQLEKFRGRATVSVDGTQYKLLCNIGNPDDAQKVLECDGEGVGLFRTEFLFMESKELPTEEEQFEAYKRAAIILK